ncbi:YxlC family protein [Alkalihalobacterium alkalinitrilicum]|uniref:YxlC family protein n=1 Tax=Alkalihalobacterium alkalinitrilicum TaxID=427920 RepID=UPI00099554FC|nr:YxlC family protein [Alkalihalobacterium alkalinitrilicum]
MNNQKDTEKKLEPFEQEIHNSLNKLEQNFEVTPPSILELEQLVETVQTNQKKKLYQELLLFWGIAIFVIALVLWSYANFFIVIFMGQIAIVACLIGYFYYSLRKNWSIRKGYQNE